MYPTYNETDLESLEIIHWLCCVYLISQAPNLVAGSSIVDLTVFQFWAHRIFRGHCFQTSLLRTKQDESWGISHKVLRVKPQKFVCKEHCSVET